MKTLKTVRLKPNPVGKDRSRHGASATQLGAEWVDIQNVGQYSVDMSDVTLYHIAYSRGDRNGRWEKVISFTGHLPAGATVRVHSGSGPVSVLRPEDLQGAEYHVFTGRNNYIWNNAEGDCSALWQSGESAPFDKACYAPNPPDGVVLHRVGDRLVVPAAAAVGYRRY